MGQTNKKVRSPFLWVLIWTIGSSYLKNFDHVDSFLSWKDLVAHLAVTNAATDGLKADREPSELNSAKVSHVIISCHLAQVNCSQFHLDIEKLFFLCTNRFWKFAALQERGWTSYWNNVWYRHQLKLRSQLRRIHKKYERLLKFYFQSFFELITTHLHWNCFCVVTRFSSASHLRYHDAYSKDGVTEMPSPRNLAAERRDTLMQTRCLCPCFALGG